MPSKPPLTEAELVRKFMMTPDNPDFEAARKLSLHRHDRIICEVPECQCPHCCHEFTADFKFLWGKTSFWCFGCGRLVYIEHITDPEDEDYEGKIFVTLNTDDFTGKD